ncbi:MAG: aromatic amino acid lyase [Acidimicrobiales bacterium]
MDFLRAPLDAELNGAGDNPLVVAQDEAIISTGNFHTAGLALALDTVAAAICQTGGLAASRSARLLSGALSGLPVNLSSLGPASSGFAPLLKTAHALVAELRHLAAPVASNAQGEASDVEDDATNAALAARRDARMLDAFRRVIAIEALVAAQGLDLAPPERVGRGALVLQRSVRSHVSSLDKNRPCGPRRRSGGSRGPWTFDHRWIARKRSLSGALRAVRSGTPVAAFVMEVDEGLQKRMERAVAERQDD